METKSDLLITALKHSATMRQLKIKHNRKVHIYCTSCDKLNIWIMALKSTIKKKQCKYCGLSLEYTIETIS